MEVSRLSRKERERLRRRKAMLEAAGAVFAERGYEKATLDEIAARAEFGKGTLYNYFEDGKEGILFAIFDELFDELCRRIEMTFGECPPDSSGDGDPSAPAQEPIDQVFYRFMEDSLRFFKEREHLYMILMKEAHRMIFSDQKEKAMYFMRQRNRLVDALVVPLEAAIQRGELRPMPPEAIAHLILGNIEGMQMHISVECQHGAKHEAPTPKEGAEVLTTLLFHGLCTNPTTSPVPSVN